ncbi:hypothetical protein KFK09_000670 [Dendrobium nobile]|uniref:Uncharacterized protein n=1 Tax=Dendrobium nobile TaxID=94219 RepID=A0A8T3C987_DENNO|nr:hypothetical protein KFK09_000670 [Dendrobium nobile]
MRDGLAAAFTIKIRKICYSFVTQNEMGTCRFQQTRGIKFPSIFFSIYILISSYLCIQFNIFFIYKILITAKFILNFYDV